MAVDMFAQATDMANQKSPLSLALSLAVLIKV